MSLSLFPEQTGVVDDTHRTNSPRHLTAPVLLPAATRPLPLSLTPPARIKLLPISQSTLSSLCHLLQPHHHFMGIPPPCDLLAKAPLRTPRLKRTARHARAR